MPVILPTKVVKVQESGEKKRVTIDMIAIQSVSKRVRNLRARKEALNTIYIPASVLASATKGELRDMVRIVSHKKIQDMSRGRTKYRITTEVNESKLRYVQ
jgi:hypothetical protein